jgi:transposase
VALALARPAVGWQLSLVNPGVARRFAESLGQRSKTDPVDTRVLAQYAARMQPEPWQPPTAAALHLLSITLTIAALVRQCVQHENRQHALSASTALPALLVRELEVQVAFVDKRIRHLPAKSYG